VVDGRVSGNCEEPRQERSQFYRTTWTPRVRHSSV